jgi:predicted ATPase/DNA-binding CsgD family transcriptional regulator
VTTVSPDSELTAREAEVLALVARHLTNAQIADELVISPRTVESHVSAMLRKLQLPDRRSLARHAETRLDVVVRSGPRRLPVPVTPFIGRLDERSSLAEALASHRMVTATGPGGIGKTRLALSVAADLAPARRDGVWFVDLVHLTDPVLVTAAVAETVGVPEQRTTSVEQALVAALGSRDALLVLDNCEHVLDGVRTCVERIVAGCPDVTVLATSRTRLLLPYEHVYVVPGLSVEDGVDLFTARVGAATGVRFPGFVTVVDPGSTTVEGDATAHDDAARVAVLCRALDGMALAIELAAARFAALGLDGLEAGLDQRLRFLTAGPRGADRHASLRAAIGWSYELLSPDDRALLRRLAVFASWFDVDAAVAVAGPDRDRAATADGLARLAEHSLLVVERGQPTRSRALETIRQYGVERLDEAGELDSTRTAHEGWCRLAVAALLRTDAAAIDDAWCARFDRIADDLAAALAWSSSADLAADLAGLLFLRGRPAQAQRRYEQAADLAAGKASERVAFLRLAAGAAASRYAGDDALRLFRAAAEAAIAGGDRVGAARDLAAMVMYIHRAPGIVAVPHSPEEADDLVAEARGLAGGEPGVEAALAVADFGDLSVEGARHALELAEQTGDRILQSTALDRLTTVHLIEGDIAEAVRVARRRLDLHATLAVGPISGFEFGDAHLMAAEVDIGAGDLVGAARHAEALAALPFYRDEDHVALSRRVLVDTLAGHFDDVLRAAERFRRGWERAGRPVAPNLARTSYAIATVHGLRGDDERRADWIRLTYDLGATSDQLAGFQLGWPAVFDGLLALHRDDPGEAERRLTANEPELARTLGGGPWVPWYTALRVEAAVLGHHPDAAGRIERSQHATRDNPIASAIVERAVAIAAADRQALAGLAVTFARLDCPYQQARTGRLASTGTRE